MNIVNTLPEYTKPKNVGLMFFSMEPEKFFPNAQIDVVQFPKGLGGNDIIEKTFRGPLHQQLRDALQYIQNVIITEKVVKHPDRAEADRFFNFPYAAVEEALSNAVYHCAYDEREPIEVRVENDRMEIVSFPGPDRSVTIEGFLMSQNNDSKQDSENQVQNETSFETSLKQVLKQNDFQKLKPIIEQLTKDDSISIQEVMELTHKSRTTA